MKKVILVLFLAACSTTSIENINTCPPCPKAGKSVAEELEKVCKDENECKAIVEWLQRYEKTCDILTSRQK